MGYPKDFLEKTNISELSSGIFQRFKKISGLNVIIGDVIVFVEDILYCLTGHSGVRYIKK